MYNKLNDLIDALIFINLDIRQDRLDHITKELEKYNFDPEKIHRLSASYIPTNGAKGCSHSHYKAIQLAIDNNWNNVLIMEDDAIFTKHPDEIADIISEIQEYDNEWDMIMPFWLINKKERRSKLVKPDFRKVTCGIGAYSTLCYFANKRIFNKLLVNFKESYDLQNTIKNEATKKFAIDCNWFKLQKRNNWYFIDPQVITQLPGYSDISERKIGEINLCSFK